MAQVDMKFEGVWSAHASTIIHFIVCTLDFHCHLLNDGDKKDAKQSIH
jgi:hypothetical protein